VDVFWEPNFYSIQGFDKNSTQVKGYRNRENSSSHRLGTNIEHDSEFAELNLEVELVGTIPNSTWDVYLGRNAFINFPILDFELWVGRRELVEPVSKFKQPNWNGIDGGEGFGFEVRYWENVNVQVIIWDYYRAYPIWYYNQTKVYEADIKKKFSQGERYRQGLRFLYSWEYLDLEGDFFYLNMGNWGARSQEDLALKTKEGGDGDHLYRTRLGVTANSDYGYVGVKFHITKGLDKTFADPKRSERSLPIRGEALELDSGLEINKYSLRIQGFIPNTPITEKSLAPLTIGYVGMGNPLTSGGLISREWSFYPSAWVTEYGLEWNNTLIGGRTSSLLARMELGWENDFLDLGVLGEYAIPRRLIPHDRGQISFKKSDYINEFISEAGIWMRYGENSEEYSSHLGAEFSYLWTPQTIGVRGTILRVYGRFVF
jgi:hypothetical protein